MRALEALGERLSAGQMLTEADAEEIVRARDLVAIGVLGDDVRRRLHGSETTFVRVFELRVDAIPGSVPQSIHAGEFRIVGRPRDEADALAAVESSAALAAGTPVTGFSLADLLTLAPSAAPLAALCTRLRGAGLQAIAAVPLDLLDQIAADDLAAMVDAIRGAGLAVLRMVVEKLPSNRRIEMPIRARQLQDAVRGFEAFAPLPRTIAPAIPSTGYDDIKQIVLARVLVTGIASIQVDWPLYGPKLAQVALTVGADDVDGVAAIDGENLGLRRSAHEEILGNIRAAAFEPVERDGLFERTANGAPPR